MNRSAAAAGTEVDPHHRQLANWIESGLMTLTLAAFDRQVRVQRRSEAHRWRPGATVVKGDDDFIVALSALSSYSNLTTTSSKPLDIVLMLDMSGSMDEYADTYKPVYADDLDKSETYYIDLNGTYQEVGYSRWQGGWGYEGWFGRWQSVSPKNPPTIV
ncbi:MAG: hypothetical protein ACLVKA_04265 [Collinsella aerofaciens]